MSLSFKGQTIVITGAGGGLGKAYSLFFASRGANIVVNDVSKEAAQKVVDEIKNAGGRAVANTSSVADGTAVIKTALDAFGGITILINNAGILRDRSFKNMSDNEWDAVQLVHLKGAFSCTKAAWPHFQGQKYGRIINTASAAGIYGNNGQANYSAAKMGLIGFTKALAREGERYGIKCTAIAPVAASAMTQTVMPPQMLEGLKPEFVAPFVALLVHPDGPDASGKVFEIGAGYAAEIRWERSKGVIFKTDNSFAPSAVRERWAEIQDFTDADHPFNMEDLDAQARPNADMLSLSSLTQLVMRTKGKLQMSDKLQTNAQSSPEVRLDGKTVIVTGAGAGLGRAYSLMFARLGANVVANDISENALSSVVDEITKSGGKVVSVVASVEDADSIVKAALESFGSVSVLVANAGILRDKAFKNMSEQDWDAVIAVHLRGTYKCAKAVWPVFQKQKYGRIVTTSSHVGIYGNFGQANYSTAKAAIIGLTRTLALEGARHNITANCIAPMAGTAMTMTILPKDMVDSFKPEYIAPVVGFLSSEDAEDITGCLFEVSGGWVGETRWQRAGGYGFPVDKPLTPEVIASKWNVIINFDDGRATYPSTTQEALEQIVENFENKGVDDDFIDADDPEIVVRAKREVEESVDFNYTERDVILYNLSVGATEKELQWTFESHDEFAALPTFGVIPQFMASGALPLDFLPNYNPAKLLHGEQFLSIHKSIPTSGQLKSTARILEVLDKGNAAAVTSMVSTVDDSGQVIFKNQSTVFIRGAGGFGGIKKGKDRGAASAPNVPPRRKPDVITEESTISTQAVLYRLNGDLNPLHVLPEFAAIGGFDKPILHGLCSMGIAGKHVIKSFGSIKDIKVRFTGVVFPGDTLVTEMWKENNKVIFITKVKEQDAIVLSNAAATLEDVPLKAKL